VLGEPCLGLSAKKHKLINFTIASFFTGAVGAFYAFYVGIPSPSQEEFGARERLRFSR
jgi:ABC-type branched-subunit amino acid transport system permease subunit